MNDRCRFVGKKRRRIKRILFITALTVAAVIVGVWIFIESNVTPMIKLISNERIRSLTTDAVGNAVVEIMSANTDREYLKIERDSDNNITSVDLDADVVNSLALDITLSAQKNINAVGSDGIKIPLGSLSGITVLTGLGPDINIKIYLVGSTQSQIYSEFISSGINQTVHRLYIDVSGSVAVAVPGLPSTINTSTQVLVSETVIVGKVPPTYLHSSSVGDMLDLVAK